MLATSIAGPARAGEDQFFGLLLGGAAGGLIGNQFGHGAGKDVATGIGVVSGAWIGSDLGRAADNANRGYMTASYTTGSAYVPEANYNNYNSYTPNYVAPPAPPPDPPVNYNSAGMTCREFSQTVQINSNLKEIYGTACLQPDGSWRVVQ